jgi:type II secretory pathway pseudopilin PulG
VKLPTTYHLLPTQRKSGGFTLIELLIFISIFSVVIIAFITIFLSILRVYSRQSASSEVDRQSQFLLQSFQLRIERASLVDIPADIPTSTLLLRTPTTSTDPTTIYLQSGMVYLQETTSGVPQAITTSKVNITNLSFTRRVNSSGHDSVELSFSMEYVSINPAYSFAQSLETSIARVSAATFDSDLIASTSATYNLGIGNANWRSINGTIYFQGSNVGVGVQTPNSKFQVSGGDVYIDTSANGLILKDSNGVCWRVRVTTGGAFTSASITCP